MKCEREDRPRVVDKPNLMRPINCVYCTMNLALGCAVGDINYSKCPTDIDFVEKVIAV